MGPNRKLLEAAAAATIERIRRDRGKAPAQIQPLLAYLEGHLFDGGLDATSLKRACGVRDNTLPLQFHHVIGLPPYAYIEDCRLEVACRLLRDTDLKLWQIAQNIGYSALQVFSRAFDRWSGLRPSIYRQKIRAGQWVAKPIPPTESGSPPEGGGGGGGGGGSGGRINWSMMRKALDGELERDEADELATLLAELYPDSFLPPSSSPSSSSPSFVFNAV